MRWSWDTGQPWSTKKLEAQPSFASFLPISCWTWMDSIKVRGYQNMLSLIDIHTYNFKVGKKLSVIWYMCQDQKFNAYHFGNSLFFYRCDEIIQSTKSFQKIKTLRKIDFFWFLPLSDISYSSCKENTFAFQST